MSKTEIKVTCADCLFYNDLIHPSEHFTCKLAGYLNYSSPCDRFCFNMNGMTVINSKDRDLLGFVRKVPTDKLSELAALLVQEGYNRNRGWSIGDICYFNLGKEDCIATYVQVVFKGLADRLDAGLVEGVRSHDNKLWTGTIQLNSLLKQDEWQRIHQQLVKEKKFYDNDKILEQVFPGYKYPSIEEMSKEDYHPQDIQNFFKLIQE